MGKDYLDKEGKVRKYKRLDEYKCTDRRSVLNRTRFVLPEPQWKIIEDTDKKSFKKIVDQVVGMNQSCQMQGPAGAGNLSNKGNQRQAS